MKLKVVRKYKKEAYTIGELSVDGKYLCDTLEDRVRDLTKETKIAGKTAIPEGEYEIIVSISPRFRRKLPRLLEVPGFSGILIHRGNTPEDTAGCILVGENREPGRVINSTHYELLLTELIEAAQCKGEKVTIEII